MLKNGTMISDRYEIIQKIGSGGMSIVYKAKCHKLNRIVAIKVLRKEFSDDNEFLSRFNTEAQAVASLSHSNIVNVYDVGFDDDINYIVMEYIDGVTLKEYIQKYGPLKSHKVINIGIKIAEALKNAHNNNIIHRDIKPQNILVTAEDEIKVTDFGIAQAITTSTIALTSNAIGSVHYFSPEQARGGYIDEKSDIYSLGIVLYELCTNILPYSGDSLVSVALKHINEELVPPSKVNKQVSKSLESIIIKATQKKQESRYKNANEIIGDLKKALVRDDIIFDGKEDIDSKTVVMSNEDMNVLNETIKNNTNWNKKDSENIKNTDEDLKEDISEETDDYVEENKIRDRSRKRNKNEDSDKVVVISAVITSFIIIGIISYWGYNHFIRDSLNTVIVPDIKNLSFEEAENLLRENNLSIDKKEEVYDDEVKEDYIISQNPEVDIKVDKETIVEVIVSKGEELYTVPNLVNKDYKDAQKELLDMELQYDIKSMYSDLVPIGLVVSQGPEQGTELRENEVVILNVSLGPEIIKVEVPNIKNITESEAKRAIQNASLVVGTISRVNSDDIEEGRVIYQSVSAYTKVKENYIIDFTVSEGPEEVEIVETDVIKNYIVMPILNEIEEKVIVKIVMTSEEDSKVIYNAEHIREDFPFEVPIKGRDEATIQLYINGELKSAELIDFGEVN